MSTIRRFARAPLSWADDEGASAVEYALMVSLIVVMAMTAMLLFSESFSDMVDTIQTSISDAV